MYFVFQSNVLQDRARKVPGLGRVNDEKKLLLCGELRGFLASHLLTCFYQQTFRKPAMKHFLNSNELFSNSYLMNCGKWQRSLLFALIS